MEVGDSGSGMPPHVLQHLFAPFFTTKPPGVGTGLGLSICHRIVTALGGEITAESALGKGTIFRVRLPASSAEATVAPTHQASTVKSARRGRILVIDDEPLIAIAIRRTLSGEHDVTITENAREALERVAGGEAYDLIFCDLMMPEMTGMELHAELARRSPERASSMIFLTGGAFTEAARNFLDSVSNPRMEKPFDTLELRALATAGCADHAHAPGECWTRSPTKARAHAVRREPVTHPRGTPGAHAAKP